MNSWGILGKPTPEKIQEWQNMPYGQFKTMVADLKKKSKGNSLKKYRIRVQKIKSTIESSYQTVEAFTNDNAIEEVKKLDKNSFKWHEPIQDYDKYTYQVICIE
jgi:NADH:ubiquinone oxidoreductase subunit D